MRWGRVVPVLLGGAEPQCPTVPTARELGGLARLGLQEGARRCKVLEVAGMSPSAVFGFQFVLFFHVNVVRMQPGCMPLPAHPCQHALWWHRSPPLCPH